MSQLLMDYNIVFTVLLGFIRQSFLWGCVLTFCLFCALKSPGHLLRQNGSYFKKKANVLPTCLLHSQPGHSPQNLLGRVYFSFLNHAHARSMFWPTEHSWVDSTLCRTLAFVLLGLPLVVLVRLFKVKTWTVVLRWMSFAVYLGSGPAALVCCWCGLCA